MSQITDHIQTLFQQLSNDNQKQLLEHLVENTPQHIQDDIYRKLQKCKITEEIKSYVKTMSIELTDTEINHIANLYVYHSYYNCSLSYWENIENLINNIMR